VSFPRYPKYKDSGVEWLGEVPEHWEAFPNRALFVHQKREVGAAWAQTELLSLTLRGVIPRDIESGDGKYPSDFSNYQIVKPGELVFCLFDMDETPRTVGLSSHFGMITSAYDVFECKPVILPRFVYYFYLHVDSSKRLRPFYTGLRKTVRTPTFLSIKTPLPPLAEQAAIASFLDRETAKIDALIAEQQRLIELLQEKRQAVISHAVTKGLNPDAPMKDSGIEWLGEVPVEWTVKRVKHLVTNLDGIQMGPFGGMLLDLDSEDTGYKVYGQENTISGDFGLGCRWISLDRFNALSNYHIRAGDLLLTRKGSLGNARLVETLPQPGIIDSDTIRVRVDEDLILQTFLSILLHEAQYVAEQIALSKRGAILPGLNSETIANIAIILPPKGQQLELMMFLAEQTAKLDALTVEAQRGIDILQERRSALISAAVTGQIDVRRLAPKEAA
jgi:type I restriction enzyme S subunit